MSEIVHTANDEFLESFCANAEMADAASLKPRVDEKWIRNLLAIHIAHLITLCIEIHHLHADMYPDAKLFDINPILGSVCELLVEDGFWKELPPPVSPTAQP